jgi:ABC-type protease/lipase transport system fused ATPase/permease subunit
LDQTRHTIETRDHEYVHSEMIMLFSRVCAFYEEEGHAIMDCPFVPFHIRACFVMHMELQNVVGTLMINHRNKNKEFL